MFWEEKPNMALLGLPTRSFWASYYIGVVNIYLLWNQSETSDSVEA